MKTWAPIVFLLWILLTATGHGGTRLHEIRSDRRTRHFVPCPERGYIIQLRTERNETTSSGAKSVLQSVSTRPVGGRRQQGFYVIDSGGSVDLNQEVVATFRAQDEIRYSSPLFSCAGEPTAILPEIVVRLTAGTSLEQLNSACHELGTTIQKRLEFTEREYLLNVPGAEAQAVFATLERLHDIPFIEWAAANTAPPIHLSGQVFPDDEHFAGQWHLHNAGQGGGTPGAHINAVAAWQITTGDPNVVVAVLDCGVDSHHPDLVSNLVEGYDFYDGDEDPDPDPKNLRNAHGTSCAGLIAARGNNGIGVAGVAWDCRVMPVRIMSVASGGALLFSP